MCPGNTAQLQAHYASTLSDDVNTVGFNLEPARRRRLCLCALGGSVVFKVSDCFDPINAIMASGAIITARVIGRPESSS